METMVIVYYFKVPMPMLTWHEECYLQTEESPILSKSLKSNIQNVLAKMMSMTLLGTRALRPQASIAVLSRAKGLLKPVLCQPEEPLSR